MVDAVDNGEVRAFGRGRNQDPLRAGIEMLLPAFAISKETGAFQRDFDAQFGMRKLGRIALRGNPDPLSIDDHRVAFGAHFARERPVNAVALEQHGIGFGVGQVVDRDQFQVVIIALKDGAGDEAADAAETIDGDFSHAISLTLICARTRSVILGAVIPKWS